ncbi:metal-dependent hydrolase [Salinicoccus carnicancri]|uniref:metal-dependent hydrolase n=1 Tax=Salinicoccus carnicancri TaxID=558170 RepID=UPI0002ED577D|nr:metal-dependent hydrolase [Salinicoccus carnicancri]
MTGKTHIIGGIASSLASAQLTGLDPVIMVGAGIIGALVPDICHGGSRMGRALPMISKLINLIFGHRSFTHSLLFLVIISFLMDRILPYEALKNGLMVGMISHLLLDMATRSGIQLFFPISFKVRFPVTIRTGSLAENLIFSALALVSFYFGWQVLGYYI